MNEKRERTRRGEREERETSFFFLTLSLSLSFPSFPLFPSLQQQKQDKRLKVIYTCNELNAGYAADGYSRARGGKAACVVATFTVGGLSLLNAVAGAASESLPVICITGGPNSNDSGTNRVLHHTIGSSESFAQEMEAFKVRKREEKKKRLRSRSKKRSSPEKKTITEKIKTALRLQGHADLLPRGRALAAGRLHRRGSEAEQAW
mgnify:CR=1 FL=1